MDALSKKMDYLTIDKILMKQFWHKPSIQLSIVFSLLAIGVFTSLSYSNFLHLQAQNIDKLSVFNEIIKPLSGVTLLLSLIVGIVTTSQLVPYFFSKGQQSVLQQMSLTTTRFFVLIVKLNLKFVLIPLLYFVTIVLFIELNSDLDFLLFLTISIVLILGIFLYLLIALSISLNSKKVVFSLLVALVAIILIISLDQVFMRYGELNFLTLFNKLLLNAREANIPIQEVIRLIIWLFFFVYIVFKSIENFRNKNKKKFLKLLLITLMLVVTSLKLLTITVPEKTINISSATINQLPKYYQNQLQKNQNEIEIIAVVDTEESRDELTKAINYLKAYKHDLSIRFSSRQAFMGVSSEINGQIEEFVSVKVGNKQQSIRYPFASSAHTAIAQLIDHIESKSEQWITFIQGHDEVSVFAKSGRSFSKFYSQLKSLGFPVIEQNLREQKFISDNTKLVVIADSKEEWLAGEVEVLMEYLNSGGNLLVMHEAEDRIPKIISTYLGVTAQEGTLIDESGFSSGTPHPAILIVNQFTQHNINQGINSLLAFPWSVGLNIIEPIIEPDMDNNGTQALWKKKIVLASHQLVWNEITRSKNMHTAEKKFIFKASKTEKRKSHLLLVALERSLISIKNSHSPIKQKVVVVGDSSFISDMAVNNYANLQLGINLINWLLTSESLSQTDQLQSQSFHTPYRDNYIQISPLTHFILNWFFSVIFPLVLLLFFNYQRIKRQKHEKK